MRILPLLTLFVLFTPTQVLAQAETPIGEFIELEGSAFIVTEEEETSAEVGDPIFLNDTIETEADTRAMIQLKDETEIILGSKASLKVDTYVFDPADTSKNEGDLLVKGPFVWMSGLLPKNNRNVNIQTPLGSIGIRGTTVWGGTLDAKFGVFVFDGKVFFTNSTGRVTIEKDEGVFVTEKSPGLNVKKWGNAKIEAAFDTIALSDSSKQSEKYLRLVNKDFEVAPETPTEAIEDKLGIPQLEDKNAPAPTEPVEEPNLEE